MAELPTAVQQQIAEADKIEQMLGAQGAPDSPGQAPQDSAPAAPQGDRIAELEAQLQSAKVEQGRVRALSQQLREAQQQIESLNAKLQEQAASTQAPPPSPERDELVDSYGEELVAYMEKVAAGQAASVRNEVKAVAEDFQRVKQGAAESAFWSDLNRAHPDWQQMQSTKEGQAFLLSPVPYDRDGRTFDELLQEAARAFDGRGAIEVFTGLKAHLEQLGQADPRRRLEQMVVPGRSGVGQGQPSQVKPVISLADYQKSNLEYAKNQNMDIPQRYGAKTMDEWDAMFNQAAAEGRVR